MSEKIINMSLKLLHDMLLEAYYEGWHGLFELGENSVESIIERRVTEHMVVPPPLSGTTISTSMPFVSGDLGIPNFHNGISITGTET